MRYEKGHKAETRRRIMEVASRRFRDEGIAAVGLAGVMADAGLTNGAFYAHFDSKEDLVREILELELQGQRTSMAEAAASGGLEGVIREYLSVRHRDHREAGCPSAALLDEIGRRPSSTREAYTHELLGVIDVVAEYLDRDDPARARVDALVVFGSLIGTIQLARAITDPSLAADILERGVDAAMTIAGVDRTH